MGLGLRILDEGFEVFATADKTKTRLGCLDNPARISDFTPKARHVQAYLKLKRLVEEGSGLRTQGFNLESCRIDA